MILYGIPNCDTVRKARKFLDENKIAYDFYDFKKQGLTLETIQNWLQSQPIEILVNKRSTSWKQLNDLQKQALLSGDDLTVLTEMPTLIKRPVLESETSLLIGFKEEEYQKLIAE
ncbi:arsenate reductase [Thiomicrorhabdus sp. Kp2]|uniref:arsenate reductase n=1 Tax=Thiomicrorhabdus sp. Kp2 TaxID=1123518 RepID=UPI00040B891A|nr:arsenate reductase [Thiomicrorhabdus sp. Kp2]